MIYERRRSQQCVICEMSIDRACVVIAYNLKEMADRQDR